MRRLLVLAALVAGAASGRSSAAPEEAAREADSSASREALSVRYGRPVIRGSLPRELLLRVAHRGRSAIVECYGGRPAHQPELSGEMVVRFVVRPPGGTVEGATVTRSSMRSRALERCVLDAVGRWRFGYLPPGISIIELPILFGPETSAPSP